MIKKTKISLGRVGKTTVWIFLLVCTVITVFFAVEQAAKGSEIAVLENEETTLNKENRELTDKLVQVSSLNEVNKKANELGFTKPTKLIYVSEKESVAKLP